MCTRGDLECGNQGLQAVDHEQTLKVLKNNFIFIDKKQLDFHVKFWSYNEGLGMISRDNLKFNISLEHLINKEMKNIALLPRINELSIEI